MTKAALYRHIGASGETLYIGCSINPFMRFGFHLSQSEWAHDVRSISIEWFDTQELALEAEKAAIQSEKPPFNKQWNADHLNYRAANEGHVHLFKWLSGGEARKRDFIMKTGFSDDEVKDLSTNVRHIRIPKQELIALATKGFVPRRSWHRPCRYHLGSSGKPAPIIRELTRPEAFEELAAVVKISLARGNVDSRGYALALQMQGEVPA